MAQNAVNINILVLECISILFINFGLRITQIRIEANLCTTIFTFSQFFSACYVAQR